MALVKLYNLARMTVSGTPGTATITLLAAVSSFLTFALAGVSDGELVRYAIEDGGNREIGYGTYTAGDTSNTLSRDVVHNSTNGGAKINCTSAAVVFIDASRLDFPWHVDSGGNIISAGDATNPVMQLNFSGAATGIKITGAAAGSRVSLAAISSGTNEGLDIDAKGSGTIRLGWTSTGLIGFRSGAVLDFGAGNYTLTHSSGLLTTSGPIALGGGASGSAPAPQLTFGSYFDTAGDVSVSHIDLYGGIYGFGISGARFNYIVGNTGSHAFYTGADLANPAVLIGAYNTASTSPTTGAMQVLGGGGFTKKVFSGEGFGLTGTLGSTANAFDASGQTAVSVANGGNADIASNFRALIWIECIATGEVALYMLTTASGGNLISGTGSEWVAPTSSPAAGKMSVSSSATGFAVYNNRGGTATFRAISFRLS
jgi:hypothetical protein